MRTALILSALAPLALLSACGDKTGKPAGPERRSAAGEVLGGEVGDAMLPLDTARSTSPPGRHAVPGDRTGDQTGPGEDRASGTAPPKPPGTAAPMPDMTMPADPEPLRTGEQ